MSQAANKPFADRGATTRIHPLAGHPPPASPLIDPQELCRQYYVRQPDAADPAQFGFEPDNVVAAAKAARGRCRAAPAESMSS